MPRRGAGRRLGGSTRELWSAGDRDTLRRPPARRRCVAELQHTDLTRSASLTWFLRSEKGVLRCTRSLVGPYRPSDCDSLTIIPELQARALRTPGRNHRTPADGSPDSGPKSLDSSPDSRDDPLDSSAKSLESGMLKTELQRARTRSSELARPDSSELRPGLQRPTRFRDRDGQHESPPCSSDAAVAAPLVAVFGSLRAAHRPLRQRPADRLRSSSSPGTRPNAAVRLIDESRATSTAATTVASLGDGPFRLEPTRRPPAGHTGQTRLFRGNLSVVARCDGVCDGV